MRFTRELRVARTVHRNPTLIRLILLLKRDLAKFVKIVKEPDTTVE